MSMPTPSRSMYIRHPHCLGGPFQCPPLYMGSDSQVRILARARGMIMHMHDPKSPLPEFRSSLTTKFIHKNCGSGLFPLNVFRCRIPALFPADWGGLINSEKRNSEKPSARGTYLFSGTRKAGKNTYFFVLAKTVRAAPLGWNVPCPHCHHHHTAKEGHCEQPLCRSMAFNAA